MFFFFLISRGDSHGPAGRAGSPEADSEHLNRECSIGDVYDLDYGTNRCTRRPAIVLFFSHFCQVRCSSTPVQMSAK